MGRRDAEAQRTANGSTLALVGWALFFTGTCCAQLPCDSAMPDLSNFNRIFSGGVEPWQLCGDTVETDGMKVIYSFPQCCIWAEREDGSTKWSKNLSPELDCKVWVFKSIHPIPRTPLKRSDMLIQLWDKRIFSFHSRRGRFTYIPPNAFPISDTGDQQ